MLVGAAYQITMGRISVILSLSGGAQTSPVPVYVLDVE
jgi:hypothetical protein